MDGSRAVTDFLEMRILTVILPGTESQVFSPQSV
jgi:hypothetical protein